ncbi:MAG TPA: hypothetical protein V6D00_12940, partial [Pantanalinema sp.]
MKKLLAALAFTVGLGSLHLPAFAATSFEPGIEWKTLESDHFRVNYPPGLEQLGRRVLAYAEDAHKKVAPYMGVTPYEKTEIVCFDTYDDTNANASNYPHNRIMLNLHPPSPDSGFAMGRYDDWIRYVILHEYTHIIHNNATPWHLVQLNAILGQLFFSNVQLQGIPRSLTAYIPQLMLESPRFVTEGWAVTTESKFTPGGRAKEGDLDMRLRMATLEGKLYGIDQVNGSYELEWPTGGNEYDYGTAFFQYLIEAYGEDKPPAILRALGRSPLLGIDFAVGQVIPGKNGTTLWNETMAWLKRRTARQVAQIKEQPLTEARALTAGGRHHHHPRWLSDGSVTVTESYKGKSSALVKVATGEQPGITRLFGKAAIGDAVPTSDGRFIYYATQGEDRYASYSDLYRFDAASRQVKQLTTNRRAAEPAVSPDGTKLVAVVTAEGSNYLVLFDGEGRELKRLTSPTPEVTYANPSFSPDGTRLVASRWKNGRYNLVELNVETLAVKELTSGDALDFYPAYTADGKYLTFTSDRSGVFNLYALRLSDGTLRRLTNVVGGAFDGRVSPDGKQLAFIDYGASGYDLKVMPFAPERGIATAMGDAVTSDFEGRFVSRVTEKATPVEMDFALSATPRPYSPWPTLAPNTYLPFAAVSQFGAQAGFATHGRDVLYQHFYYLYGGGYVSGLPALTGHPYLGFTYQNDQWLPSLSIEYSKGPSPSLYGVVGNSPVYLWQDQQALNLQARLPGIPTPLIGSNWVTGDSVVMGLRTVHNQDYMLSDAALSQFSEIPAGTPIPASPIVQNGGLSNSVYAMYQKANNFRRTYSVSPEGGSISTLGAEVGLPVLGGSTNYQRVWGDYRQYISLPWTHHVLAVRGLTGLNFGQNGGQFTVGGWDGSNRILNQMDLTAATDVFTSRVGLRGYDAVLANTGNQIGVISAEYRFPIAEVNRGLWTLPFYLDRVYGAVGYEAA